MATTAQTTKIEGTYQPRHAAPTPPETNGKKISLLTPVPDEGVKARTKVRIHVTLILISGTASTVLLVVHAANPALLGFGPIVPSVIQEIVDRIKYL
jgi:hypothetical protein